jgi:serine/threonine-protein kinase
VVFDAAAADRALLRARFRLHHRDLSAPRAFLDAICLDPANADAYAGLAQAYLFLAHQDVAPAEIFPLARAAAAQAMGIDPSSAAVRLAQGRVLQLADWAWDRAEEELRAAIAIAPDLAEAHLALAHLLVTTGRVDAGLDAIVRARTLSPLSPLVNALEGGFLTAAGDAVAARVALDRALDLEPDFWMALAVRGAIALGNNDTGRAVADLEHAADASGRLTHVLATLALAYVAHDQRERAECLLAELLARHGAGHVPAANIAAARLALGQHAEALEALEQAHRERAIRMVFLGIDRRWNPVRAEPRFRALLDAMALPDGAAYSWL